MLTHTVLIGRLECYDGRLDELLKCSGCKVSAVLANSSVLASTSSAEELKYSGWLISHRDSMLGWSVLMYSKSITEP
jgi:hypothetical protein